MSANSPSNIIPSFKKVKDPLTNLQNACEFVARLSFDQAKLKIQASVDGGTYANCTFEVLSNFPPMIRILGVTIPRDAYSHPVQFKMWHEDAVNGDSPVITTDPVVAVFDMPPPDEPIDVVATVLRDRVGIVPDQVKITWGLPTPPSSFMRIATRTFAGDGSSPASLTITEAGLYRFVPITGDFNDSGHNVDISISGSGYLASTFYQSTDVTVTPAMIAAGGVLTFAQNRSWFECSIAIEKWSVGGDTFSRKSNTFAIFLLDDQGKKRQVGTASDNDNEIIVENCSRFGTQDGVGHQFRFGVQFMNRSTASAIVYSDPVTLTTTDGSVAAQTPDDIAGTAQYLTNTQFSTWLSAQFPATDPATVASILSNTLTKIKDVVAKGGSVTLSDFGVFKASWTPERTAYRNGQYITVAPVRNADFMLSLGFQKGTKSGQVMSDTEAASV